MLRSLLGYFRYESTKDLEILNDLYRNELRVYKNFFQPVIKLKLKDKTGGRIHRRYDVAKTPYQRVMESPEIQNPKYTTLVLIDITLFNILHTFVLYS